MGETWDTFELLDGLLGLPNDDDHDTLLLTLCSGLGDETWCRRDPFSLAEHERLRISWEEFCDLVKHDRRFFFGDHRRSDDERQFDDGQLYDPADLLTEMAEWCRDQNLARLLAAGTALYRARFQKSAETLTTARQLGPPPADKAIMSNRMSPPGIVMFYVSESPDTALRETANDEGGFMVAEFRTRRDAVILDLGAAPPIPSLFETIPDSLPYDPRVPTTFLRYFASDISRPIARDDRQRIEYIPTQIVTEYFRTHFQHDGKALEGIRYMSARHPGHYSLVLFSTQEDVMSDETPATGTNPWIELAGYDRTDVTIDDVARWLRETVDC